MPYSAKEFFNLVVVGNYDAFHGEPGIIRHAMNFAVLARALCDWTFVEFQALGEQRVCGSRRAYTKRMRSQSREYDLLCDIGDSWKHVRLGRKNALLSNAKQLHQDRF